MKNREERSREVGRENGLSPGVKSHNDAPRGRRNGDVYGGLEKEKGTVNN